jgi:hypothetical protein
MCALRNNSVLATALGSDFKGKASSGCYSAATALALRELVFDVVPIW